MCLSIAAVRATIGALIWAASISWAWSVWACCTSRTACSRSKNSLAEVVEKKVRWVWLGVTSRDMLPGDVSVIPAYP